MTSQTPLHALIEPKVASLVDRYAGQLLDENIEVANHTRNAAIIGCVMLADTMGNAKEWPNILMRNLGEQGISIDASGMSPDKLQRMARIAFASVKPAGIFSHEEILDRLLLSEAEDN